MVYYLDRLTLFNIRLSQLYSSYDRFIGVNEVRGRLPSDDPLGGGGGTYRIPFESRFWRKDSKIGAKIQKSGAKIQKIQKNFATTWRKRLFRQKSILSSACRPSADGGRVGGEGS